MRCAISAVTWLGSGPGERQPVDERHAAAVDAASRLPGEPPAGSLWSDGGAALAVRPIAGSMAEPPIHRCEVPGLPAVVLDGSLDNRRDLQRRLGLNAGSDDAAVLAHAYRQWGLDCAGELVGEYAFILWDAGRGRLVAARDVFGCRELFLSRRDGLLRLGSQLWQVAAARLSDSDINEEYVADFLAALEISDHKTPLRGVERLPSGHLLVVEGGNTRQQRYWRFERRENRSADAEGAARMFQDGFTEAVGRCLETGPRVWTELSGGLDSSAIACVAADLTRRPRGFDRDLTAVSFVWDETPQSDERQWAVPVAEKSGLECHWLASDDLFFDDLQSGAYFRSEPHFGLCLFPMLSREGRLLREQGVDALLSGARAESVIFDQDEPPIHLVDLLKRRRFRQFRNDLSAWQDALQLPLMNLLLDYVVRPIVRPQAYLRKGSVRPLEPWIDAGFARRKNLVRRRRNSRLARFYDDPTVQHQYERLLRSEQRINRGYLEWSCEFRHPFLYRPLVESVLDLPWLVKARPGVDKPLLRDAMVGILPEEVRTRQGKRGPGPSAYKAFARRWDRLEPIVSEPLLASLGFVDAAAFRHEAELVRFGAATSFGSFTTCLAMEIWFRTALDPSPAREQLQRAAAAEG